jgi:hypothetical protein
VRFTEHATRTIDGPGRRHTVRAETMVSGGPDGPRRRILYAETDGSPVAPERLARIERRVERALGPAGWWTRPPALPGLLQLARAEGPARAGERAGTPAWEVEVVPGPDARPRGGFDRGVLWFERRPGQVRLVSARFERRLPAGGHAVLEADFTRVAGLDLPLRHAAEIVLRQRRRVRWFTTLVRAEVEYEGHVVR